MLEGQLAFTHVSEAELVDDIVRDRPGVAGIELMIARADVGAETRNIRPRCLEVIERLKIRIVGKVVVEAEILPGVDVVIEAEGELILSISADGYGLVIDAVGPIGCWNEAQHIERDRVHAWGWDGRVAVDIGGKDIPPVCACNGHLPALGGNRRSAARPAIQRVCRELVGNRATEGTAGTNRKNTGPLLRVWNGYGLARDALSAATAFKRDKKESPVFYDRAAESSAELILIFLRLDRIEVSLRIQNCVAEILIDVSVPLVCPRFGDDVDHRAGVAAVLRIEGIADDAKFINRVGGGLNGW